MTNKSKKVQAVLFSALMVLSVVAGVVAFSGSAFGVAQGDAELADSGTTYWQGQDIWLENGTAVNVGTTLQLRTVDDNKVKGLATEFQLDTAHVAGAATGKGTAKLSTSGLEGYYVITAGGEGSLVYEANATGMLVSHTANGGAFVSPNTTQVNKAKFEVAVQTLSLKLDDSSIDSGTTTTLEVTSNRGTFDVRVSSPDMDEDDLTDVFAASGSTNTVNNASKTDEDDKGKNDRESIIMTVDAGEDLMVEWDADFTDDGTFTFDFEVLDTDAEASATITVRDPDPAYSFSNSVYSEERGDVAEVQVNLVDATTAYVFVGGEDVNYLEAVQVTDGGDKDGKVVLEINTYNVGRASGVVTHKEHPTRRSFINGTSYSVDGSDDSITSITRYNTTTGTTGLDIDTILSGPMASGNYDLRLSSTSTISTAGVVADEKDIATLALSDRATTAISLHKAPEKTDDYANPGKFDVDDDWGYTTVVADGGDLSVKDMLIVKVQQSGVYGYVTNKDLETVLGGVAADSGIAHGMNMTIKQTNEVSNQDAIVFALTTDDANSAKAQLYTKPADNTWYVLVDSADATTTNGSVAKGQDYEVKVWIDKFNPYVKDDDASEDDNTLKASFSYIKEEAKISGLDADDDLRIQPESASVFSGTASVAPGSELSIRVRNTGDDPFLKTKKVDVASDGTWSATFDLSDVEVGTSFKIQVSRDGTTISDEVEVEAVADTATPTAEPKIVTRTIEVIRGTPTPQTIVEVQVEVEERTVVIEKVIENVRTVQITPTPGQPGFGLAIAVVALLAAALLAVRRKA